DMGSILSLLGQDAYGNTLPIFLDNGQVSIWRVLSPVKIMNSTARARQMKAALSSQDGRVGTAASTRAKISPMTSKRTISTIMAPPGSSPWPTPGNCDHPGNDEGPRITG